MRKSNRRIRINSLLGQIPNHREYKINAKLDLVIMQLSAVKSKGSKVDMLAFMNTYKHKMGKMNRKQKEGLFGSLNQELGKLLPK